MKFGRTGLAVLGLFAVSAVACPQPSHKKNDGGQEETGGEGDDTGGSMGTGGKAATGGSSGDTGGSMGNTGGAMSTGGSMGNTGGAMSTGGAGGSKVDAGMKADSGGGGMGGAGGAGGGGGGADMMAFTDLYNNLIKPKCGPGCHITGTNGGLTMPNAMTAYTNLVNKPSMGCPTIMRVVPGDPSKSLLSAIVKPMGGMLCAMRTNQMPKGKTALTAAEMMMIDTWIKGP